MKAILQQLLFAHFLFFLFLLPSLGCLAGYVRQYVCLCLHCAVSMAAAFQVVFLEALCSSLLLYSLNLLGKWS